MTTSESLSEKCRSCGAPVEWKRTVNLKWAPYNPDGTSHFSNCPQSNEWRKRQAKS